MIIESLEALYRTEATNRQETPNNPFRASAMGRCIREGCFDLLGLKGEPLQPRRLAVFKHGDLIHEALTADLRAALGDRFIDPSEIKQEYVEIDGAKIGFHIDFAFKHNGGSGVGEIKTMSDFAFNRALKGEIDNDYLCQAWVYFKGTNFNPVVFLAYRKETSAMVEIIFDRQAHEKVVTQRLTGDPIELAKQDPILLTEIKSPFDESVEEYVRERVEYLKMIQDNMIRHSIDEIAKAALTVVPGKDAVEDEVESVQGKDKLAARSLLGNFDRASVEQSGSWYKFKTGRKILGFPCNYCRFLKRCYPNSMLEMKGDRPIWVIP